jgi:NADH-quinone oxidoreductase subunit D
MATTETMTINMGPQHPSTHGVLRLVLELDGEIVVKAVPHIGFLHRGIEKLSEHRTYHQVLPLTDRLDYLAPMHNNLAYVLAVEKLLGITDLIPERAQVIRVMLAELTRLKSHLVWLACHALDIGAMTVFIYCFRERERIMDIYEKVSGARMTSNYFRVGGLSADLPNGLEKEIRTFAEEMPRHIDTYEGLLTGNKIWQKRVRASAHQCRDAIDLGISGPSCAARGSIGICVETILTVVMRITISRCPCRKAATPGLAILCVSRRCVSRARSSARPSTGSARPHSGRRSQSFCRLRRTWSTPSRD